MAVLALAARLGAVQVGWGGLKDQATVLELASVLWQHQLGQVCRHKTKQ